MQRHNVYVPGIDFSFFPYPFTLWGTERESPSRIARKSFRNFEIKSMIRKIKKLKSEAFNDRK